MKIIHEPHRRHHDLLIKKFFFVQKSTVLIVLCILSILLEIGAPRHLHNLIDNQNFIQ